MDYSFLKLKGRRTLFIGEVNTGKSSLLRNLIAECVAYAPAQEATKPSQDLHGGKRDEVTRKVAVIDLGPDFVLPSGKKLGAKLELSGRLADKTHYYRPDNLHAPRAMARSREEVISLAESNRSSIDKSLDSVLNKNYLTVFVNDITLYFQCGRADRMVQLAKKSQTFIANAYKGRSLLDDKGSGISQHEAVELERFSSKMNSVISLDRQ